METIATPTPTPTPPLAPGYTLLSALGERVSLARRDADGLQVAVKYCPAPVSDDCRASLQQEAMILEQLAELAQPELTANIVAWIAWRPGPEPLLLSRFQPGTTLAERHGDQPPRLSHQALTALLVPLAGALRAVHQAGFIHRDLSPHNILLRDQDDQPVLLDFGAAQALATAQAISHHGEAPLANDDTGLDSDQATPGFAPPERYHHGKTEGPWSDVYSLAAIAYGLMTGHYPPPAPQRDLQRPLPRPPGGDYPERFVDAVIHALSLNPSLRYRDIDGFAEALAIALPGASPLPAPASTDRGRSELAATEQIRWRPAPARSATPPRTTAVDSADHRPGPQGTVAHSRPAIRPALLLLLLAALALAGWHWGPSWYRSQLQMDWLVDPAGNGDAVTIGEALAEAPSGARILIKPGEYRESLLMDRPLTLLAAQPSAAAESGVRIRPSNGPCLRIRARSGRVEGLDLSTGPAPATEATPATSETGAGPSTPCVIVDGGAVVLENNRINGATGPALLITAAAEPTVALNRLSAPGGSGIVIQGASGGTIAANLIDDTRRSAIIIRGAATPVVHCNQIEAPGQAGLLIGEGSRALIETNRIQAANRSGIEVRAGAAPTVRHNLIEMSAETGLYLHSGAAGHFSDNQVLDSGYSGVLVADGAHPLLKGNTIAAGSEHGILVLAGARAKLDANQVLDNSGNGLVVAVGARVLRKANQLTGNQAPQVLDATPPP